AGPWLTMLVARAAARLTRGAATLLAAQRLSAAPKAAFRSVNGLVLAVFLGTAIAGIVPAILSGQQAGGAGSLNPVMRTLFENPIQGSELLGKLRSQPGVAVLPVYDNGKVCGPEDACQVVECADLASFRALGGCSSAAVSVRLSQLFATDNMLTVARILPLVGERSAPASAAGLKLRGLLISAGDPAVRERVRTLMSAYPDASSPRTFGEVARDRAEVYEALERVALAIVVLTLVVAGCGLVVSVGGGLVERRQPFTLLRLAGTPVGTLGRVVLLESALPLLLAAVLAAVAGYGVAGPVVDQLAIRSGPVALPGLGYFLTVGGGLLASLLVILAALPLLRRMTTPDQARFE
ncbi:MAG: hypothetical protein HOY71_14270, partial [Nonomuraea sp.]|nr:hypothetical protein [Nonomuraea sp.]